MTKAESRPLNIVCLATYFKGVDFIRECKSRGCHIVLVTKEKMLEEDWPRESLDDLFALPNDAPPEGQKPDRQGGLLAGKITPSRKEYAGIALSLARQQHPDTAAYNDPEIVYRVKKKHHVGLIVRSPKLERVSELLDGYARRFADDFIAVEPPLERAE